MPESAEVLVTADTLAYYLTGSSLIDIEYLSGKYIKKADKDYEKLRTCLPLQVDNVTCKGKLMYFSLGEATIFSTFGMSGSYRFEKDNHSHVVLTFDNGIVIYYNDPRQFGNFTYTFTLAERQARLALLAPSVFEIDFSTFKSRLKRCNKTPISKVLMDQNRVVCGIGNYQLSDILYLAYLSPWREINTLDDTEIFKLFQAIKTVPLNSYLRGGVSVRDYISPSGEEGTYDTLAYNKSFAPNGERLVKVVGSHGRSVYVAQGLLA
jgi:formamidopyrimidine-DNA glycosylase